MLTDLQIENFAIIERLELEFATGLTVMTGETGAGKSILVDALGLVLGDRADATAVRADTKRAEINATFDIGALPAVAAWLDRHELAADGECLLRRIVHREGRSKAFVNGSPVPLQTLRELGSRLIDIYGQQAHQSLLQRPVQRALLDHHGGHSALLAKVRNACDEWRARRSERELLVADPEAYAERLELLRHNVSELEALALGADELAELGEEHRRLANIGGLLDASRSASHLLAEADPSATGQLSKAVRALEAVRGVDDSLDATLALLADASIQLDEACEALDRYSTTLEIEPGRLDQVELRLAGIHDLARKHRIEPAELPEHTVRLIDELERLEHAGEHASELDERLRQAESLFREHAGALHKQRNKAAKSLGAAVTAIMQELGMPDGHLAVSVDLQAEAEPSPAGLDRVEFQIATNAGQGAAPLARVASGGELARIGLAIQVVAAGAAAIPVMIFDEVDSGVGGGIAEIVGRRLRDLAAHRQVLAVTHLPQVASQAHQHLRVSKSSVDGATRTMLEPLDEAAKVEELARMLGGIEITKKTRAHAQEMRRRANSG